MLFPKDVISEMVRDALTYRIEWDTFLEKGKVKGQGLFFYLRELRKQHVHLFP